MSFISVIKFIINHPINRDNKINAILRFLKWQINTRLNPFPVIYQFTDRAKLIIKKGMTGATGNLYCGLHEYNDMCFLLHFLRKEDLFIDIGANIGSYTVLSSAHIGAKTISIEPVPSTFSYLVNNIFINQIHNIATPLNIAVGSQTGSINFTSTLDTVNHVATKDDKDSIKVKIDTLDNLINGEIPDLIKIDVEGFETEVINGALECFKKDKLKAIIIELNGSGKRYGYDEIVIHNTLINFGFAPFLYNPSNRKLHKLESFGTENTIYIRDVTYVEKRLETANKVKILNKAV